MNTSTKTNMKSSVREGFRIDSEGGSAVYGISMGQMPDSYAAYVDTHKEHSYFYLATITDASEDKFEVSGILTTPRINSYKIFCEIIKADNQDLDLPDGLGCIFIKSIVPLP